VCAILVGFPSNTPVFSSEIVGRKFAIRRSCVSREIPLVRSFEQPANVAA
jgi:hypothetical protein